MLPFLPDFSGPINTSSDISQFKIKKTNLGRSVRPVTAANFHHVLYVIVWLVVACHILRSKKSSSVKEKKKITFFNIYFLMGRSSKIEQSHKKHALNWGGTSTFLMSLNGFNVHS